MRTYSISRAPKIRSHGVDKGPRWRRRCAPLHTRCTPAARLPLSRCSPARAAGAALFTLHTSSSASSSSWGTVHIHIYFQFPIVSINFFLLFPDGLAFLVEIHNVRSKYLNYCVPPGLGYYSHFTRPHLRHHLHLAVQSTSIYISYFLPFLTIFHIISWWSGLLAEIHNTKSTYI